uniref:NADH dehydrogenase subunit 4L n=1 Tax=Penthetria simplicipes TaxID=3097416 RepID=UPI002E77DE22|nr:NADH dehydrogenase subunit 4L [Penthetria simplicipes]WPM86384.1 NADH dehydrogenase subunit 4L [Penthetria simplicipes]
MILSLLNFMILFMYIMGLISFISNRKHLLSILLSLEFIVLSLYLYLFLFLMLMNFELFFLMMFLTFSVCEGALGLSILVLMIRSHGNDFFQSFNILVC